MSYRSYPVQMPAQTPPIEATKLFEAESGDVDVWVSPFSVPGSPTNFRIGGADVAQTGGLPAPGQWYSRVRPGDEVWAYHSQGSVMTVFVLVRKA